MRFVRCEACGAKALVAASQCPKCSNPLGLRDDYGKEVPLAHCKSCDTYYPRRRGGCQFCGTKVSTSRGIPTVWVTLAILTIVTGVWAVARIRDGVWVMSRPAALPRTLVTVAAALPAPSLADSVAPTATAATARVDTASSSASTKPVRAIASPTPASTVDSAHLATTMRTVPPKPSDGTPTTRVPASPPVMDSATDAADVSWVKATALTWVNVRADPRRDSGIVGVISPDTRVELGESRSGWVHVRAPGLSGWVGRKMFSTDSTGHPR